MTHRLLRLVAVVLASLSTSAGAGEWYSSVSLIAAYAEIDQIRSTGKPLGPLNSTGRADEVVGFGLALGHDWSKAPWRTELEYIWRYRTDMNFNQLLPGGRVNGFKNDIRTQQLMANVYLDLPQGKRFHPYMGTGAGVVRHDVETDRSIDLTFSGGQFKESGTDFSWAVMAGVVMDRFYGGKLQLGYRFTQLGKVRTSRYPDGAQFEAKEYLSHDIVISWQLAI